ncbi:MAG: hypothetical protein ACFFCW_37165, partial [Candidatus Hodarchaeota archaeon]
MLGRERIITRPLFVIPLTLLCGISIGMFTLKKADTPLVPILLCFMVITIVLVLRSPVVGILLLVAGTSFIPFFSPFPCTSIHSINIPDLIMMMLIVLTVFQIARANDRSSYQTPLHKPLILFFSVGFLSLVVGYLIHSYDFFLAVHEFKVVVYYLLALVVIHLIRDEKDLKLLFYGSILIGLLSAISVVYQVLISPPSAADNGFYAYYEYKVVNTGTPIFWSLICIYCLMIVDRIRFFYVLVSCTGMASLVLLFSRNVWIGLMFSFLLGLVVMFRSHTSNIM